MKLQKKNQSGYSLAEMLLVIAILAVLGAVVFIGVIRYQRTLARVERDGIAKEIFVAAQNHLSMAENQGYLGLAKSDLGAEETNGAGAGTGVYYLVVNAGAVEPSSGRIFEWMLPFAAVDETVRTGGSYILRYQAEPALVLDVFYCSAAGTRFGHGFHAGEYADVLALAGTEKASARLRYGADRAVVGWYGGEQARDLALGEKLAAPKLEVTNAEKLTVTVTDPNKTNDDASLTLILTAHTSVDPATGRKRQAAIPLKTGVSSPLPANVTYDRLNGTYTVVLDDITAAGMHFASLFPEFIPGEDVTLQAVAFSSSVLTNIEYSAEKTANSLFASVAASVEGGAIDTAFVRHIRHLENLDDHLSSVKKIDADGKLAIAQAVQTTDLRWTDFLGAVRGEESEGVYIYDAEKHPTEHPDTYWPVSPSYALRYDGQSHTVSDIVVRCGEDAGLFGTLKEVLGIRSSVSNLMLVDFSVESTAHSAGALAGTVTSSSVTNVVARNSTNSDAFRIQAKGAAGGLIGTCSGSEITACAAALWVGSSGGDAGGLIGTCADSRISACYSGGHTKDGAYNPEKFNVTTSADDGCAGGLIGNAGSASVHGCYSTCSAQGATVGGLVGSAGGEIEGCYATGLVSGTTAGALAGAYSGASLSGCHYFEAVNELMEGEGYAYLGPVNGAARPGVTALDADAAAYEAFVGAPSGWGSAAAYDETLIQYYQGRYNLKTVAQLAPSAAEVGFAAVHYGDWPAPELFTINAG